MFGVMDNPSASKASFDKGDGPTGYKEKKRYKNKDGENITNGYSLRGRQAFKK